VLCAFLAWAKIMSEAVFENKDTTLESKKDHSFLWNVCTAAGFGGGVILLFAGLLLSAVSYFDQISFHGLDVVTLGVSFVFFMLGAHFLDLAEKESKRKKKEKLDL
jgi:hypothetical protein